MITLSQVKMKINPAGKSQGTQVNQYVVGVQGVAFLPIPFPLQPVTATFSAVKSNKGNDDIVIGMIRLKLGMNRN